MFKFFLFGFVCIGQGIEQECLRVASEINHSSYVECNDYYQMVKDVLSDLKGYITMNFTCIEAASLEDITYKKDT